ncbi:MAG: hypothetical protein IKX40_13365 [Thermoguttaceae bacterium]|nr:hypothetical protein [Thermoguttaceae bacterium]
MKLSELVEHCSFHDDTLKDIRYNPETKTAEFEIVFSNYEMESFTGRNEEVLIIKLVFTDVSFLDCSRYAKRTDYSDEFFSVDLIHDEKNEEGLSFYMLNDIYVPEGYYIRIFAQDVEFVVLGQDKD